MVRTMIESMCPFFIVRHVDGTIAFYADKLGFETSYKEPAATELRFLSRPAKPRRSPIPNAIRR